MDKNARLFYNTAKKMGLPVHYLAEIGCLQIVIGSSYYYFFRSTTPLNNDASVHVCKNKFSANYVLAKAGFPVPKAVAFSQRKLQQTALADLIKPLRFPLVAKPMQNSGRGALVLCNIKNLPDLNNHLNTIFAHHEYAQIEEFHQNFREYRVTLLKNKAIGVIERNPASVVGDGTHSIEELIAISNHKRAILSTHLTISPLHYDQEYKQCLEEQGLSLKSIIPENQRIQLCHTVNTGRGGDITSMETQIHPHNTAYLYKALQELGLVYGGFDVLCEDIRLPFISGKWCIIEVNHNPDTTLHEVPYRGVPTPVTKKIVSELLWRHPCAYAYYQLLRIFRPIGVKICLAILFLLLLLHFI